MLFLNQQVAGPRLRLLSTLSRELLPRLRPSKPPTAMLNLVQQDVAGPRLRPSNSIALLGLVQQDVPLPRLRPSNTSIAIVPLVQQDVPDSETEAVTD